MSGGFVGRMRSTVLCADQPYGKLTVAMLREFVESLKDVPSESSVLWAGALGSDGKPLNPPRYGAALEVIEYLPPIEPVAL